MTDRTARTTVQDAVMRFTGFEVTALLSLTGTDAAARTCETLHLPELGQGSPAVGIGMSTLIARGKVTTDGEVLPAGEAAFLAGVCGTATTWIEAATKSGGATSVAVFVAAPDAMVLLAPAPYGLWSVWPVRSGVPAAQAAARYLAAAFEGAADRPFGGGMTASDTDGPARSATLSVDADEVWRLRTGSPGTLHPARQVDADPAFLSLAGAIAA